MSLPNLRDFKRIVFFTGAGMSAESGVPTYRGKGGIWKEYDYQEYACQEAFDRDPDKVWEFHNKRRAAVAACEPNAGHQQIAAWQQELDDVAVVTQNIDGLHQRAGATNVFELHGSLWRVVDLTTGERRENHDVPFVDRQTPSGQTWRPDIIWFGDMLNPDVVEGALQTIRRCDLLVSIGTSAVVFPAAQFPKEAKVNGATLIEINPQETLLSPIYDHCLRGPATEMLALLGTVLE